MSFNSYAQYIIHKYRLAVAVGVIQSKPDNSTLEEHLNRLRTEITETQNTMDTNVDISICEDDFNISDVISDISRVNSETILKDFDLNNVQDTGQDSKKISPDADKDKDANSMLDVTTTLNNSFNEITKHNNTVQSILTQSTYFDESQCSQNFNASIGDNSTRCTSDSQNVHIAINYTRHNDHNTQAEYRTINDNIDSQQTILYTPYGVTTHDTHISQSQDNVIITNRHLLKRSINNDNHNENNLVTPNLSKELGAPSNVIEQLDIKDTSSTQCSFENMKTPCTYILHENKDIIYKQSYCDNNNEIKRIKMDEKAPISQQSQLPCCDPESSLQFKGFDSNSCLRYGNENNEDTVTVSHHSDMLVQDSFSELNLTKNINQDLIFDSTMLKNGLGKCARRLQNTDHIFSGMEFDANSLPNSINDLYVSNKAQDAIHGDSSIIKKKVKHNQIIENNTMNCGQSNESSIEDINVSNGKTKLIPYDYENQTEEYVWDNFHQNETDSFSDTAEPQSEIVAFKILEELRKIKSYLCKRELGTSGSSDSGFKSFQPHSSYKSVSQCSELWINESAYCLLTFLTTHQVLDTTANIADEISKTMGKLVDKLHEQERYLKFMEELLEAVDSLLRDVYEESNSDHNILLQKDEKIYRLLLLNRSLHVINYTIEKITVILEDTLSNLADDAFELTNTDKSENICYVFHILEVLLKRNKFLNVLSQVSVQSSQDEDRILKKSSLTEIWRKKWNLSTEVCEGTPKKVCVLSKCSEILNRLVVQAMDGYSLVSFAALQCFNLLQN